MDVPAATLAQVRTGRDGRRVLIDDDVLGVARRLKEVSPKLSLRYNERGEFFEVVETDGGRERRVTTALEADNRLVERMRQIASPGYDYAGELDRLDRQAEREKDHAFSERTGEIAERLAHAVRKDVGSAKIIVPREVRHG